MIVLEYLGLGLFFFVFFLLCALVPPTEVDSSRWVSIVGAEVDTPNVLATREHNVARLVRPHLAWPHSTTVCEENMVTKSSQ